MQIAVAADDPTKPPFIRSEWPDPRCSLSYDELWRRLEASHFGQDVDQWRSTFILGVGSNGGISGGNVDPCCKSCHRKLSQHHTDGSSYVYDASHRYKKRTPISCGVVQSRLIRNKQHALQAQQRGGLHGLGALGLLAFHQDPARPGVDLCRACNHSIEEHANGVDPADAMVNALGLGGLAGMAHTRKFLRGRF
jgi:hypothetical protein